MQVKHPISFAGFVVLSIVVGAASSALTLSMFMITLFVVIPFAWVMRYATYWEGHHTGYWEGYEVGYNKAQEHLKE